MRPFKVDDDSRQKSKSRAGRMEVFASAVHCQNKAQVRNVHPMHDDKDL